MNEHEQTPHGMYISTLRGYANAMTCCAICRLLVETSISSFSTTAIATGSTMYDHSFINFDVYLHLMSLHQGQHGDQTKYEQTHSLQVCLHAKYLLTKYAVEMF